MALERFSVARIVFIDLDLCELAQIVEMDSPVCIDQSARRRDNKNSRRPRDWSRKRRCIRDFTTKIKSAQKCKDVGDGCAAFAAQFFGEVELCSFAQNDLRAFSSSIGGRKQKNTLVNVKTHRCKISSRLSALRPNRDRAGCGAALRH